MNSSPESESLAGQLQQVLGRDVTVGGVQSLWRPRLASTRGVYRVDHTGAGYGPAAVVVKVVERSPTDGSLPREARLHADGVLPALTGSLRAPRFHGISHGAHGLVGIWLEWVDPGPPGAWPAATFACVAGHLGAFTRSCPPPVARAASEVPPRDLCGRPDLCADLLTDIDPACSDSLTRLAYPPSVARGLHDLWASRGPILAALSEVSMGVCHGDAQRNNLLPLTDQKTVGIDWANLATGPVGIDTATLLHYALAYFHHDIDHAGDLDQQIFRSYLTGLEISDDAATARIRLTYIAQLAFGLLPLQISPVLRLVRDCQDHDRREAAEEFYQQPLPAILARRGALAEFLLDLGQEARALAAA